MQPLTSASIKRTMTDETQSGESSTDYEVILFENSLIQLKNFNHAAHAMLYAPDDGLVFDIFPAKAAVMMQLRFDGLFGFPGGLVDEGESPLEAVNRELFEEISLDLEQYSISQTDHIRTYFNTKKQLVLHFYAKQVQMDQFKEIETVALSSVDFGREVMGIIRPPLYTMEDGLLGFPTFLSQRFAGNARDELTDALKEHQILSEEYINNSLEKSKIIMLKKS